MLSLGYLETKHAWHHQSPSKLSKGCQCTGMSLHTPGHSSTLTGQRTLPLGHQLMPSLFHFQILLLAHFLLEYHSATSWTLNLVASQQAFAHTVKFGKVFDVQHQFEYAKHWTRP